jgi:methylated-DNA-[protein]-cysteine S-methyltransferase
MTEGAPVPGLGLNLLVEHEGSRIKRIFFSPGAPERPSRLAEEIAVYLEQGGPCPQADLDLSLCTDFQKRVYAVVRSIPWGRTMTYGQVAELAKSPGAARAVGQAMAANPFAILIPCHRVLARDGPGGYAYGQDIKERLLRLEGQIR